MDRSILARMTRAGPQLISINIGIGDAALQLPSNKPLILAELSWINSRRVKELEAGPILAARRIGSVLPNHWGPAPYTMYKLGVTQVAPILGSSHHVAL
ncbi:hypothetical protein [Phenylobacterium montanum]|uniref:Uncharacterized protein n=1 Tax=Phenylobacterium montanum TaxID=2823693 RepID=A0A975G1C2_9CAUL|nr:hypothetical protein [Caulobacter sp. S6]QUD89308.1 hypothetical protein KCG34_05355 [Caulobacter sp. S6]